jgi:hypothetical protein
LQEFTEQPSVESFCEKFKKNAQKNFELFKHISSVSKIVNEIEQEIKGNEVKF